MLLGFIPKGKGKHAADMLDTLRAVLFIEVDDNFGVTASFEGVTELLQAFSQFREVVAFPIISDPDGVVFVCQGLFAAGQVDDGEPPMSQATVSGSGVDIETASVRTSMG